MHTLACTSHQLVDSSSRRLIADCVYATPQSDCGFVGVSAVINNSACGAVSFWHTQWMSRELGTPCGHHHLSPIVILLRSKVSFVSSTSTTSLAVQLFGVYFILSAISYQSSLFIGSFTWGFHNNNISIAVCLAAADFPMGFSIPIFSRLVWWRREERGGDARWFYLISFI